MVKRKDCKQSCQFSLALVIAFLFMFISAGFLIYLRAWSSYRPQFNPSAPGTFSYTNKDRGYTFSYPSDFKYVNERGNDLLIKVDTDQMPYSSSGNNVLYPTYLIHFYEMDHPLSIDWLNIEFQNNSRKEEVVISGTNAMRYIIPNYREATVFSVNGRDYIIDYYANYNPVWTSKKYLDVYRQIVGSMQFFAPAEQQVPSRIISGPTPTLPFMGR